MTLQIMTGDSLEVLATLPDNSIDAVVTDPPYGLSNTDPEHVAETIGRWLAGERDYLPTGRGFMGKEWDGFVPPPALWDECLRVLKPGGHVLAFAGSRTMDLMSLGLRLAGFDIRDSVAWLYGSGFPKSMDISKAIDKNRGHWRGRAGAVASGNGSMGGPNYVRTPKGDPVTPEAQQWEGWGTALKPAHEPVVCARKPFNTVPLGEEVDRLHHLIGGLLWLSLSPAKRAELTSPSSPAGQPAGTCVSALVSAALDTSPDASGRTATFNSPALASTSSSIASSWSATLGALSARTRTSTTSTASSTTTALRTLNSLLGPITSQTTMPKCGCLLGGPSSPAPSVAPSSSDEWAKWLHTLSASVPATATEGIALAVASALAQVAGELSDAPAEASSAAPTATTGAAASRSAFEPVIMARKPFKGTVAANVLEHGTGALNIDASRIGNEERVNPPAHNVDGSGWGMRPNIEASTVTGRFPANVILDEDQAAVLDEQSGVTKSIVRVSEDKDAPGATFSLGREGVTPRGHNDSGGASRFFYVAKAPKSERPFYWAKPCNCETAAISEEWSETSVCGNCGKKAEKVMHATVKPLSLMRYLIRMVTPPGGVVLEPFAGSGTTVEAALEEGVGIIAVERDETYLPLIQARIDRYMTSQMEDLI